MACKGKQVKSAHLGLPAPLAVGEVGLVRLEFIGESNSAFVGFISGATYPFHQKPVLYVDRRDLAHLLGPEFRELF